MTPRKGEVYDYGGARYVVVSGDRASTQLAWTAPLVRRHADDAPDAFAVGTHDDADSISGAVMLMELLPLSPDLLAAQPPMATLAGVTMAQIDQGLRMLFDL